MGLTAKFPMSFYIRGPNLQLTDLSEVMADEFEVSRAIGVVPMTSPPMTTTEGS